MDENVVEQARNLKGRAMDARDAGNFARAHRLLDQAAEILRKALAELATADPNTSKEGKYEIRIRSQLLHIYGSSGGVYRREKLYVESAREYDEGDKVERKLDNTSEPNSYNLTQRLVARALIDSKAVANDDAVVVGEMLRRALVAARIEIERQQTTRSKDAYAMADLFIVSILLGDPDWTEQAARFEGLARNDQYCLDVTREVLGLLREKAHEQQATDLEGRLSSALARAL